MTFKSIAAIAILAGYTAFAQASPIVSASTDASALANAVAGSAINISNATLTTASPSAAGTFTNGGSTVGFDSGVVLTTGTINCIPGPNTLSDCTGPGSKTSLAFDFISQTGKVFFQYVFGSEEYNEYVGSVYNDEFQLLLNGVNIALLPGAGGVVSINNVNCDSNAAYYRSNSSGSCANQNLNIQYDGLTTILTASADVLAGAVNRFEFLILDRGDSSLDSGVFIKAGSFSGVNPVPLPGTLFLMGAGLLALGAVRRKLSA